MPFLLEIPVVLANQSPANSTFLIHPRARPTVAAGAATAAVPGFTSAPDALNDELLHASNSPAQPPGSEKSSGSGRRREKPAAVRL